MNPFRLLITGSRKASPAMLTYAHQAVNAACTLGWAIDVGEAEGVDAAVIAECDPVPVDCLRQYRRYRWTRAG